MKQFNLLIGLVCIYSIFCSAENQLKLISGAKIGNGVSIFLSDIEFQKQLFQQTTGYVRFGGASYTLPDIRSGTVTAEVTQVSLGARAYIGRIYFGLGYEYNSLNLINSSTNTYADGSFSGPTVEIGNEIKFGPIVTAISIGAQLARVNLDFKEDEFNTGLLKDGQSILTKLECSIGYLF